MVKLWPAVLGRWTLFHSHFDTTDFQRPLADRPLPNYKTDSLTSLVPPSNNFTRFSRQARISSPTRSTTPSTTSNFLSKSITLLAWSDNAKGASAPRPRHSQHSLDPFLPLTILHILLTSTRNHLPLAHLPLLTLTSATSLKPHLQRHPRCLSIGRIRLSRTVFSPR